MNPEPEKRHRSRKDPAPTVERQVAYTRQLYRALHTLSQRLRTDVRRGLKRLNTNLQKRESRH